MKQVAEVAEEDYRVVRIEDRDARLDGVKPGAGGELGFKAVRSTIDIERPLAGRRLVAKIADEDRLVIKAAVDLVVQAELDVTNPVPIHILSQLRIGIDLRNDE